MAVRKPLAEFLRALGEFGDDQALAAGLRRHIPGGFIEAHRIDIREAPLQARGLGRRHREIALVETEFRRTRESSGPAIPGAPSRQSA